MSNPQNRSGIVLPVDFRKKAPEAEPATQEAPKATPFERLEVLIRSEAHSDVSVMDMIAQGVAHDQTYGFVLASTARDVLADSSGQDISYADVMLEMYRRIFFDPNTAARYNLSFYMETPEKQEKLVAFLETSMAVRAQPDGNVEMIKKPE